MADQTMAETLKQMSVSRSVSAAGSHAPSGARGTKSCESIANVAVVKNEEKMKKPPAAVPRKVKTGDWLPDKKLGNFTKFVHAGEDPDPTTGAIVPPIFQSTTFVQESVALYQNKGYSYSRTRNPSVTMLEDKLTEIEGGKAACCFSSGMAATTAVLSAFLRPGDHCIMPTCSYGGTHRCAKLHFSKYGIDFEFVDFRDLAAIERSVRPGSTKLIFSETPCNPTLFLADVQAISQICKKYQQQQATKDKCEDESKSKDEDKDEGILHVCDSTFATPCVMQPLLLGADMALVSTTKFYDGHNITVGGAVICRNPRHREKLDFHRNMIGSIMTPQTAFYTLLTTKTMPLRMARQCSSALRIAEFLEKHPKVQSVIYPGLPSFPQRQLALKQHHTDMHGSMIGFEVHGGTEAGIKLMDNIPRPWSLCENLGSVQSIVTCPAVFTHAAMQREERLKAGITDGFIRLSVGIEDVEDLIKSLEYGLSCI